MQVNEVNLNIQDDRQVSTFVRKFKSLAQIILIDAGDIDIIS